MRCAADWPASDVAHSSAGTDASDRLTAHITRFTPAIDGFATSGAGGGTTSTEQEAERTTSAVAPPRAGCSDSWCRAGAHDDEIGRERVGARENGAGDADVLVEQHLDLQPVGAAVVHERFQLEQPLGALIRRQEWRGRLARLGCRRGDVAGYSRRVGGRRREMPHVEHRDVGPVLARPPQRAVERASRRSR